MSEILAIKYKETEVMITDATVSEIEATKCSKENGSTALYVMNFEIGIQSTGLGQNQETTLQISSKPNSTVLYEFTFVEVLVKYKPCHDTCSQCYFMTTTEESSSQTTMQ